MKTLAIVSKGKNTSEALKAQLDGILGPRIKVVAYSSEHLSNFDVEADLVVASGKFSYNALSRQMNGRCPVILARRAINHDGLDKLFDLPSGTDVLLVNDILPATEETIAMLTAMGADHVRYHAYAPDQPDYPLLETAVTPGERQLVPSCVRNIVDIKTRLIDITTLTQILEFFSMLDDKASLLSANYINNIVRLIRDSKQQNHATTRIKNQLQIVINSARDGIIALDDRGCISVLNPVAEKFLSASAANLIGKNVGEIGDPVIRTLLSARGGSKDPFVKIGSHYIVVSSTPILPDNPGAGAIFTLKDVSEIQRIEENLRRKLVAKLHVARYALEDILGQSPPIRHAVALARKLADSDAPILIQAESGTGKELLAQGIHNASRRKDGPFIAVNFAAMTESLLESELFGYEDGAFTGARKGGASGLFEQAHKGTLFLDEVGDAPPSFQVKLLRVLQEQQVRRVGGMQLIPIDVRIISATNKDLRELVEKGSFRQDLYYRLNVLPIGLPPLRERKEDILTIAGALYDAFARHRQLRMPSTTYFSLISGTLEAYRWPGNIRELQNVVEYLVNICPDEKPVPGILPIQPQARNRYSPEPDHSDLNERILREIAAANQRKNAIGRRSLAKVLGVPESVIRKSLDELEREGAIRVKKGRTGLIVS